MVLLTINGMKIIDFFENKKVFVIAEIGINHNGNFDKLIKLIEKAKESNADAVKFQIFSKESFYIPERYLPEEVKKQLPIEVFRKVFIEYEKYKEAFKYSKSLGLIPFATPLDIESFEFLNQIDVEVFKVASSDITYIPLLKRISASKKPIIISTGFSPIKEVKRYLKLISESPTIIMYCVSRYPSKPSDISLSEFTKFRKTFESPKDKRYVGFSDHTKTLSIPVSMVALGAKAIEKHLTLDENDDSYDNIVSISPQKFKTMVEMIREVEEATNTPSRNLPPEFVRKMSMRSFVALNNIPKNNQITENNIEALRPAIFKESSIENWNKLIGKKTKKEYLPREPL